MKKVLLSIILLCSVLMTGCVKLTDMTEQESNMMAEYMAGVVLKHSGYKETLVYPDSKETLKVQEVKSGLDTGQAQDPSQTAQDPAQDPTQEPATPIESAQTPSTPTQSQTATDPTAESLGQTKDTTVLESFNALINNKDFDVNFSNYSLLNNYPAKSGGSYFNLEPSNGNKLFVIKFKVANLSSKTKNFNLIDQNISYKLEDNSGVSYAPLMTVLVNDLQFINVDIAAGDIYNAVVVFEVPKDKDLTKMNLNISKADKSTIIAMN